MIFTAYNGAMQTTSAPAKVATGTSLKTMLQVKQANVPGKIIEWGCSFDGSAAATPGVVELIDTGTVNATVTASVAADITQVDAEAVHANINSTFFTLSTTTTGYTATIEGSTTTVRNLAAPQLVAPTNQFVEQFPLGCQPYLVVANYMRIRMTFGTTVNAFCYVTISY
jgi:hypothetical protein